jgi:2-succinyl-6-hydroxy-2,4-cyclohexadiene-1-carboxylate synthase
LGSDWEETIRTLETEHFCLAPDLPGHGGHEIHFGKGRLSMPAVAADLLRCIEKYHCEQVTLIGYSLGARLALYTAIKDPARFTGLILESGGPGIEDEYERRVRIALDDDRAYHLRIQGIAAFLEDWYKAPLFESLHRHPEKLDRLKKSRTLHNADDLAAALQGLSTGRQPSLWQELDRLRLPTLLITGALDHKFSRLNRLMAELIPFSEWKMLGDAGHNTHLEQPEAFQTAVARFLHERVYRDAAKEKH